MRTLAIIALLLTTIPSYAHDHWINRGGYKAPTGESCCGENDCFVVPESAVKITPMGYIFYGNEVIPYSEMQRSEDGKYWRCKRPDGTRRCVFAPKGDS